MIEVNSPNRIPSQRILVIDDEAVVCLSCARILTPDGHQVDIHQSSKEGLKAALTGEYDLILLDVIMPDMDGIEVLRRIKEAGIHSDVVIITGYATVQTAVEAMKQGAGDWLGKPFTPDELRMVVKKVVDRSALVRECADLRHKLDATQSFEGMIGASHAMEKLFTQIRQAALRSEPVLIQGEIGTGKEMVARAIHRLSPRQGKPLLLCDCTLLAPLLLENELFGQVKASSASSPVAKRGMIELAHQGSLFLNELSSLSPRTQEQLLGVLDTRCVRKIGTSSDLPVDVRWLAASSQNLEERVAQGELRKDLLARLSTVTIQVPPLRERAGDIPRLASHFLSRFRQNHPEVAAGFSPEALLYMEKYHWPGNVPQLKSTVEKMATEYPVNQLEASHLPDFIRGSLPTLQAYQAPRTWAELRNFEQQVSQLTVEEIERRFLIESLYRAHQDIAAAAAQIGITSAELCALMQKYKILPEKA